MNESYILEVHSSSEVREYKLAQPVSTIGRSADNLILLEDIKVSRHHAKLELHEGILSITDLDSSNGTILNGNKIEPGVSVPLKENDILAIADSTLTVRFAYDAEASTFPLAKENTSISTGDRIPAQTKSAISAEQRIITLFASVLLIISVFLPWVASSELLGGDFKAAPGFLVSALVGAAGIICGAGSCVGVFFLKNKVKALVILFAGILALIILLVLISIGTLPLFSEYGRTLMVMREGFYIYILASIVLIVTGIFSMRSTKR